MTQYLLSINFIKIIVKKEVKDKKNIKFLVERKNLNAFGRTGEINLRKVFITMQMEKLLTIIIVVLTRCIHVRD